MKNFLLLALLISGFAGFAQTSATTKTTPLPAKTFKALHDSTTSMDIVMMQGKGGSISLEGRNVMLFNSYFLNQSAVKTKAAQAGMIMWQINGREFASGNYFLGDSTGYVVINKDGKEYGLLISKEGNSFFKSQIKQ
ncbi:MAG: hypothetical protein U0V74_10970 [Chitinophagales bacterium]